MKLKTVTLNTVVVGAAACLLVACGSAKDASKENFAEVLRKYMEGNPDGLVLRAGSKKFPAAYDLDGGRGIFGSGASKDEFERLDALVGAGLLSAVEGEREQKDFGRVKVVKTKTYSLTAEGEKSIRRKRGWWPVFAEQVGLQSIHLRV